MTSIGKYRHLSHAATAAGHFVILAIDHRSHLLKALNQSAGRTLSDEEFASYKMLLMEHVLPPASGLLADPGSAIGKGIAQRLIRGGQGIIAPIEVTDYELHPSQREMNWIPGWSIAKLKQIGGAGVKMLLPYHPRSANAAGKRDIVASIIRQCAAHDLPFYLEPIAHSLTPGRRLDNAELLDAMLESTATFCALGVDCLKLPFPVNAHQSDSEAEWRRACEKLNAACTVPWTLLSAGVDYATFERQARIACQAGASGVIVGRAVWAEAIHLHAAERTAFLASTARQRMERLAQICAQHAAPWFERTAAPPAAVNWYENYPPPAGEQRL